MYNFVAKFGKNLEMCKQFAGNEASYKVKYQMYATFQLRFGGSLTFHIPRKGWGQAFLSDGTGIPMKRNRHFACEPAQTYIQCLRSAKFSPFLLTGKWYRWQMAVFSEALFFRYKRGG